MSWLERPEQKSSNPATKFLEWSSEKKCFKYYDKEAKENVFVPLPLKFVILEHYHTVKGWNDASESGIYSNEVLFTGSEEMEVKAFKGGVLAKGLYKEIKHTVADKGGHYCRSIYVVLSDGELVNISLKGSAVREYSEFDKINGNKWQNNWMAVTGARDEKKGRVDYSVPIFEVADPIKDSKKIIPFVEQLQNYMREYFNPVKNISEVDKYKSKDVPTTKEEEVPF